MSENIGRIFRSGYARFQRLVKLDTPAGEDRLIPLWVKGSARLGRDYEFVVEAVASREEKRIDARQLLGNQLRAALLLLGRVVLFLSGWEVAIVITVVQLLIAYWEDDDLQSWLERCAFGKSPRDPLWSAGKQHEGFAKALKAWGLQAEGGIE